MYILKYKISITQFFKVYFCIYLIKPSGVRGMCFFSMNLIKQ